MSPPMRLEAYYYSFEPTGEEPIDRVLSAVACAGKSFHNTSEWHEASEYLVTEPFLRGKTCVEQIENAAKDAAEEMARLRADAARWREARAVIDGVAEAHGAIHGAWASEGALIAVGFSRADADGIVACVNTVAALLKLREEG